MTTRRSRVPAIGLGLLVAVIGALFIAYAYQRNRIQRETQRQVERAMQAAQQLQRPGAAPAGWQLARKIAVGLSRPVALAWTPSALYVVGDGVVRSFDAQYAPKADLRLPQEATALQASRAGGPSASAGEPPALLSEGRLIVGFRDSIATYDSKGTPLARSPSYGQRAWVTGLAQVGDEIWVADSGNRIIHRCRKDGSVIADVGRRDEKTGYPGLLAPSPHLDLALTPDGNVLVNNPGKLRVEVWSPQAKLLRTFGKAGNEPEGFCGCCNPIAVAALPDGRIVTAEKGLVRVKVYRKDGSFEGLIATTPALSRGVDGLDVATTSQGEVLVLDPRARAILVFQAASQ